MREQKREWVRNGIGSIIIGFVSLYWLIYSRFPLLLTDGPRVFAAPSLVIMGAVMAAGLRILGVRLNMERPLEAVPPLLAFCIALALSRTPVLAGLYRETGGSRMTIYTCTVAGMLLIDCVEGLYRGKTFRVGLRSAAISLGVMGICLLAQWLNETLLKSVMVNTRAILPRDAWFYLCTLVFPLAIALGVGIAIGLAARTGRRESAICCLAVGCVGVAGKALVSIPGVIDAMSRCWPIGTMLDVTRSGVTMTDALALYVALVVLGIAAIWRGRHVGVGENRAKPS